MRIIGLAGWSGSGKTTLVTSVIPVLVKRGLKVATVASGLLCTVLVLWAMPRSRHELIPKGS